MVNMDTDAFVDARVIFGDQAENADATDRFIEAEQLAAKALMSAEVDLPVESLTKNKDYF